MEPEPSGSYIRDQDQLIQSKMVPEDFEEVDPGSPTYVCFSAIVAFISTLFRPGRATITSRKTPSTSPRSV